MLLYCVVLKYIDTRSVELKIRCLVMNMFLCHFHSKTKSVFKFLVILRDTLLISSMLHNSEAWYNVTNAELDLLESVDLLYLRRLLKATKNTPKEMLYLELGCIPFRKVIMEKRISFLHYIINQDEYTTGN